MARTLSPIVLAALCALQGCTQLSPAAIKRSLQIGSASTSQTLCTTAFVSGLDPADAYRDEIRPATGFGLISWALKYEVDRDRREVTTTVFGTARRRAVYREGTIGTQRVLPADWVRAARSPTLNTGYGRGFWLNNTDAPHPLPGRWGMKGAPADAYFARGYLGQFIVMVPSLDLVVVRLGQSFRPGGDIDAVGTMVGEIAATLSSGL